MKSFIRKILRENDFEWTNDLPEGVNQSFKIVIPRNTSHKDLESLVKVIYDNFYEDPARTNTPQDYWPNMNDFTSMMGYDMEADGFIIYIARNDDGSWSKSWGRNMSHDDNPDLEWLVTHRNETYKQSFDVHELLDIYKDNINESDFDWADDIPEFYPHNPQVGMKWYFNDEKNIIYTITKMGNGYMNVEWDDSQTGNIVDIDYKLISYFGHVERDEVMVVDSNSLNESEFEWAIDTPSYDDMNIDWLTQVVPYLTGYMPTFDEEDDVEDYDRWTEISEERREDLEPLAKHYFVKQLSDIEVKGGKFLMAVEHWQEFADLFKDCDYQGYICQSTAEAVLNQEDMWEPYSDVVSDWKDEVWNSVDTVTYKLIIKYINDIVVGNEMRVDGEERILTKEDVLGWSADSGVLGQVIDETDVFEDLRLKLKWAYEGAYNDATRDNYWNAAHDAITDLVGEGEWKTYEVKKMGGIATRHELMFDVTNIFMDVIRTYFDEYCDLSYDYDCELQYSSFLDNLRFVMEEGLSSDIEPLNPRVSDWPDSDKVKEYFNERMGDEIYY